MMCSDSEPEVESPSAHHSSAAKESHPPASRSDSVVVSRTRVIQDDLDSTISDEEAQVGAAVLGFAVGFVVGGMVLGTLAAGGFYHLSTQNNTAGRNSRSAGKIAAKYFRKGLSYYEKSDVSIRVKKAGQLGFGAGYLLGGLLLGAMHAVDSYCDAMPDIQAGNRNAQSAQPNTGEPLLPSPNDSTANNILHIKYYRKGMKLYKNVVMGALQYTLPQDSPKGNAVPPARVSSSEPSSPSEKQAEKPTRKVVHAYRKGVKHTMGMVTDATKAVVDGAKGINEKYYITQITQKVTFGLNPWKTGVEEEAAPKRAAST